MKKIEVWSFAENDGVGVSERCSQQEAYEAMKHYYSEGVGDEQTAALIRIEDVVKSRIYRHRNCDVGTIGDPCACYDCGEPHLSNGREIWVWHRKYPSEAAVPKEA